MTATHDSTLTTAQALRRAGEYAEAEAVCRAVLSRTPDDAEALHFLGMLACEAGRLEEAAALVGRAVALFPESPRFLSNLAVVLGRMGRHGEAIEPLRRAIALRPDHPESHNNLGAALEATEKLPEAIACFRRAIALRPAYVGAHANLSGALRSVGQIDAAEQAAIHAMRLADCHESRMAIGGVLQERGKLAEALESFDRAIALAPASAEAPAAIEAHVQRGVTLLLMGRLTEGFAEYEWRRRRNQPVWKQRFSGRPWDGSRELAGQRLLLWAEGGMGNTVQFIRYAPLLAKLGARVFVQCQPPLKELLAAMPGVQRIIAAGEALPECDLHAPLPSLPALMGTELSSIPSAGSYLDADADCVTRWRERLSGVRGLKIGINWQSDPRTTRGRLRCIPLDCFAALARLPGVRLFNLHARPAPFNEGIARFPLIEPAELDGPPSRFCQTAALIKCLDLVITSDTSTAHLAGALGVRTWVALRRACDWRWMLDRCDTPWYPSMRLYRQQTEGDWAQVMGAIAKDLEKLLSADTQNS